MSQVKVVLPNQPAEAQNLWIEQKTGIIGPPGIGKSEFPSHNPKTLYLQCEAGLGHLKVMKVPVRSWADWEGTWTALSQANQAGNFLYDTVVVDTIDRFVDYANEETCERGRTKYKSAEINVVGDIPNGAGWAWSTDLVMNALGKLETLPAHIIYIGHLDRKEIKQPNQVSVHLQTISIGGKTGRELVAWPDHLLNIQTSLGSTNQKRVVKTIPTSTLEAKSRGGVVKNDWEWSASSKENWEKFRSLFQ